MFYYGRVGYAVYGERPGVLVIEGHGRGMTRHWWWYDGEEMLRVYMRELGLELVPDWIWPGWIVIGWVLRNERFITDRD